MNTIPITDEDLKLIISTLDFRAKKLYRYVINNDLSHDSDASIALDKVGELSYRLRLARNSING